MPRPRKDYTGCRKGRLTVLKDGPNYKYKERIKRTFVCQCDCGKVKTIDGPNFLKGSVLSCGCLRKDKAAETHTTHNLSTSSEYHIWEGIKGRCYNKNNPAYQNYGARNIKMCLEWRNSFEQFLKDMGPKPSKDYSIERVEVNGNYEPSNCIWLLKKEQPRNTRRNKLNPSIVRLIRKKYSEGLSIKDISQLINQSYHNVYDVCKNKTWKNI